MKLHVFGASGAGVTTLGRALSGTLGLPYFDSDDYFWLPAKPDYTQRRPAAERAALLAHDLAQHPSWILGGLVGGWDDSWWMAFDLVVFLWLPPALRLQRLAEREQQRYGAAIATDPNQAARTAAFLEWAAGYDDSSTGGTRTIANHTAWLGRFACPVLELRGDLSLAERVAAVMAQVQTL